MNYEEAWNDLLCSLVDRRKDCIRDGLLPYAHIIDEVIQEMFFIEDKQDEEEGKAGF